MRIFSTKTISPRPGGFSLEKLFSLKISLGLGIYSIENTFSLNEDIFNKDDFPPAGDIFHRRLIDFVFKSTLFFHYKISIYKEKERNIKVIRIIIRNGWGLKAGV